MVATIRETAACRDALKRALFAHSRAGDDPAALRRANDDIGAARRDAESLLDRACVRRRFPMGNEETLSLLENVVFNLRWRETYAQVADLPPVEVGFEYAEAADPG